MAEAIKTQKKKYRGKTFIKPTTNHLAAKKINDLTENVYS